MDTKPRTEAKPGFLGRTWSAWADTWRREPRPETPPPGAEIPPVVTEGPPAVIPPPASNAAAVERQAMFERTFPTRERLLSTWARGEPASPPVDALLDRFLDYVFTLPASPGGRYSERGGLYLRSLTQAAAALKRLENASVAPAPPTPGFEDGPARRRYAVFVAALLQGVGRVFDLIVRSKDAADIWDPLATPLYAFCQRHPDYEIRWRPDRKPWPLTILGSLLVPKLLTAEDQNYLGRDLFTQVVETLSAYVRLDEHPLLSYVCALHRPRRPKRPVPRPLSPQQTAGHFVRAVKALMETGTIKVNEPQGHVYVQGEWAAVLVPYTLNVVRQFLRKEQRHLPENAALYRALRDQGWTLPPHEAPSVKNIAIQIGAWRVAPRRAIILRTDILLDAGRRSALRTDVSFDEVHLSWGAKTEMPSGAGPSAAPVGATTTHPPEETAGGPPASAPRREETVDF